MARVLFNDYGGYGASLCVLFLGAAKSRGGNGGPAVENAFARG